MNSEQSDKLRRSAGRARRLIEFLIVIALALMAGATVWGVVDPQALGAALQDQGLPILAGITDWQARALDALLVLQIGVWTGALFALRGVFVGMNAASPFPPASVTGARRAYRWILAGFVLSLFAGPIDSVLGSWHMPAGQRQLAISFGSAHALTLVALALTAIMSRAFALAAELWQDHQEIV